MTSSSQMPGLGLTGISSSLNTMAGLLSGSTPAPYAQAAAGGAASTAPSGPVGSSNVSTSISVTSGVGASSGATSNGTGTGGALGLLGSSPGHGALSGGILNLVPGQTSLQGSAQVPVSPVGATPGGLSSEVGLGGNGGSAVGSGGMGTNVAPARPPSGLKQNGATSKFLGD